MKKAWDNSHLKCGLVIGAIVGVIAKMLLDKNMLGPLTLPVNCIYLKFVGILGPLRLYAAYLFPLATALIGGLIGSFFHKRR